MMAGPPAAVKTFNRLALLLAGRRLVPVWGVLRHSGRKSGREFSTPLAFVATPGAFFVGLPWGRGTDWVRNVRAAGRCTVRLGGREYECSQPEFVGKDVVMAQATGPLRPLLGLGSVSAGRGGDRKRPAARRRRRDITTIADEASARKRRAREGIA